MTWRDASRDDRVVAWYWASCAALLVAASPLAPLAAAFSPACPWHAWTGVPCPGCGATRAAVRLARGDLPGALAVNPLAALGAIAFLAGGILAPAWLRFGGRVPVPSERPKPVWIAVAAAAVAANWAWLVAAGV